MPIAVSIRLEQPADYEETAHKMRQMHVGGTTIQTIASAFSLSWSYARDILHFAYTGEHLTWGKSFVVRGTMPLLKSYRKLSAH